MKCANFEKQIYLFNELTPAERERLHVHLRSCAECTALLKEVQETLSLFSGHASTVPASDTNRITQRIMSSLPDKKQSFRLELNNIFAGAFLRPAFTFVAFFLAGFLLSEVTRNPYQIEQPVITAGSVRLDRQMTATLATSWLSSRASAGTSTLNCLHECQKINENTCFECLSNK